MKLTDDAKKWHRLWSVRIAVLTAALGAAEASLGLWKDVLPDSWFAILATGTGMATAVARVIKQNLGD